MDVISEMLTKIRNAQAVFHPTVEICFSNLKYEIAKILEKEDFVGKVEVKKQKPAKSRKSMFPSIEILLKYEDKIPAISGIKRISKPGQRIYQPAAKIKKVKEGFGISIISTSKGLMTGKEAKRQKLGGEVICEVW
ncbi:MAG: 30S ribosomal protein S8 [Candidatus Wildermuthbacteria bacterium]|nr:30S ribosomal protein S8 [Candidatus Wildermuthbacteria bacterium]